MQRKFPFLATLTPPRKADAGLVARMGGSESRAVAVSLIGQKAAAVAAALRISPAYLSQIAHGKRTVPDWFTAPFCALTGTALLEQVQTLAKAQRIAAGEETESDVIRRLAAELRAA